MTALDPTDPGVDHSLAHAVLDALPDPTAVVDAAGVIVGTNLAWRVFSEENGGTPARTGVGVAYLQVCDDSAASCQDAAVTASALRQVLAGELASFELEYPCPSTDVARWFLLRITPLDLPAGGAVLSHVHITNRKLAEEALEHQARHDPLTGLCNRTHLERQLALALTPDGTAPAAPAAVLYVDLDGFKAVNDRYGHLTGDEILRQAAERLRGAVRQHDTVARMGGDEFVILCTDTDEEGLRQLAARLREALHAPYLVGSRSLAVGASVGTHLLAGPATVEEALHAADTAMYRVKSSRERPGYPPAT